MKEVEECSVEYNDTRVSLFSQSLFALPLFEAIESTAAVGFRGIELACAKPHLDLEMARRQPEKVADHIQQAGLTVSALSLFNNFTDPRCLDEQVESAETFIRLAPMFRTNIIKMTPGPPGSGQATEAHWQCLERALNRLVPVATEVGVRLAFETHMRQLTDTLASSQRFLAMAPSNAVGLTVDFLNLRFAGEEMGDVLSALKDRMYHAHVKNGTIDREGCWHFQALDQGLLDYSQVIPLLRDAGYDGWLSIECLGPEARNRPMRTADRDLRILAGFLQQA